MPRRTNNKDRRSNRDNRSSSPGINSSSRNRNIANRNHNNRDNQRNEPTFTVTLNRYSPTPTGGFQSAPVTQLTGTKRTHQRKARRKKASQATTAGPSDPPPQRGDARQKRARVTFAPSISSRTVDNQQRPRPVRPTGNPRAPGRYLRDPRKSATAHQLVDRLTVAFDDLKGYLQRIPVSQLEEEAEDEDEDSGVPDVPPDRNLTRRDDDHDDDEDSPLPEAFGRHYSISAREVE